MTTARSQSEALTTTLTFVHVGQRQRMGGGGRDFMPAKVNGFDRIKAYHGKTLMGFMDLKETGEIAWVGVHPKHRRQGVATAMFRHAQELGLNPQHSTALSDEARQWANSCPA